MFQNNKKGKNKKNQHPRETKNKQKRAENMIFPIFYYLFEKHSCAQQICASFGSTIFSPFREVSWKQIYAFCERIFLFLRNIVELPAETNMCLHGKQICASQRSIYVFHFREIQLCFLQKQICSSTSCKYVLLVEAYFFPFSISSWKKICPSTTSKCVLVMGA